MKTQNLVLKVHKRVSFETALVILLIILYMLEFSFILNLGYLLGDLYKVDLSIGRGLIFILILQIVVLFIFLSVYHFSTRFKFSFKAKLKFYGEYYKFSLKEVSKSLDYIYTILLLVYILIILILGFKAGKVQSEYKLLYIIFCYIVDGSYSIYYLYSRETINRKLFLLNLMLYFVAALLQGWTGVFLMILIYEIHYRYRIVRLGNFLITSITMIIILSIVYIFLYPLKLLIRLGNLELIDVSNLLFINYLNDESLIFSSTNFIERVTLFSNTVFVFQEITVKEYVESLPNLFQIINSIKVVFPFIKGFLSDEYKNNCNYSSIIFMVLNNLTCQDLAYIENRTVPSLGILGTLKMLSYQGLLDVLLYICFSILYLLICKVLLDILGSKAVNIYWFYTLLYFVKDWGELFVLTWTMLKIVFFATLVMITLLVTNITRIRKLSVKS